MYYKLLSIVSSFNLNQVSSEPTRISNTCSNLIDLICVSPSVCVKQCHTISPLANADHLGLLMDISTTFPPMKSQPVIRKVWRYNLGDFERAAELLETIKLSLLIPSLDSSYWSHWKAYFLQIMGICIPYTEAKINNSVRTMPLLKRSRRQTISQC